VIFSLGHYDAVSGIGDLTIWTAAFGALPFSTDATAVFAVSDDGTRVLATQGTNSAGTATNLVVGGVDGSAPIQVAAASRIGGCSPRVGFTGGRFIASNCPPASTEVSILSIDPMTGDTAVLLTPALNYFAVVPGPAGLVAVVAPDRSGFLVPVGDAGGATAAIGQVDRLLAAPAGRAVLAATAGALRRVPTDGSAPATTLIDQGVAALQAISDDGRQVLYQSAPGTRNGYGDLLLASAVTAGAPLVLSTSLDTTTFGSAFTADGGRALYITQASDLFVGVLQSQPVGGGPPSIHGRDVWVAFAYADTRVVFDDDYVPVPKRFGRAVLRAVDTAAAAAPTVLATHAGAQIALTHARDRVVFSFDDGSGRAGLYVTPLP
jgi:hypothetical protein